MSSSHKQQKLSTKTKKELDKYTINNETHDINLPINSEIVKDTRPKKPQKIPKDSHHISTGKDRVSEMRLSI